MCVCNSAVHSILLVIRLPLCCGVFFMSCILYMAANWKWSSFMWALTSVYCAYVQNHSKHARTHAIYSFRILRCSHAKCMYAGSFACLLANMRISTKLTTYFIVHSTEHILYVQNKVLTNKNDSRSVGGKRAGHTHKEEKEEKLSNPITKEVHTKWESERDEWEGYRMNQVANVLSRTLNVP